METTPETLLRLLKIERRTRPEAAAAIDYWTQVVLDHIPQAPKEAALLSEPKPSEHPGQLKAS